MRKTAQQAWSEFSEWCDKRGLRALPAHPWTVAAFARWCERRLPAPQIARSVVIIARVHLLACQPVPDRHPTVRRTLRAIAARQAARRQGAALFQATDFVTADEAMAVPSSGGGEGREGPRRRRILRNRPALVARRPGGGKRRD